MNNDFSLILGKCCRLFKNLPSLDQTLDHLVQARKRSVLGEEWGVLCAYVSQKGVCYG